MPSMNCRGKLKPCSPAQQTRTLVHDKATKSLTASMSFYLFRAARTSPLFSPPLTTSPPTAPRAGEALEPLFLAKMSLYPSLPPLGTCPRRTTTSASLTFRRVFSSRNLRSQSARDSKSWSNFTRSSPPKRQLTVSANTVFYLAVTAPHTDKYEVHGPVRSAHSRHGRRPCWRP